MVTTGDILTRDALQRHVRERAEQYAIPDRELNVDTYQDATRAKDIVRVHFRTPDRMEKYQAEMAFDIDKSHQQQIDLIDIQIDDTLSRLEESWLKEGGNVTYYKNHGFFYSYVSEMNKACLEVQCTVCNHVEMVNEPTDILDEYRDVFLMKMLPKVHAECDCPAGKYDSVQRPTLHGLTR